MGACAFGGRQRGASLLHSGGSISAAVQHAIIPPWPVPPPRGSRYTRARPPLRILAVREYPDRSAASRAEWQLKQQPRERKLAWLQAPAEAVL